MKQFDGKDTFRHDAPIDHDHISWPHVVHDIVDWTAICVIVGLIASIFW